MAERHGAIHATACLRPPFLFRQLLLNLAVIIEPLFHRPVTGNFAPYLQKPLWVAHTIRLKKISLSVEPVPKPSAAS
jgi:hypothetical protein